MKQWEEGEEQLFSWNFLQLGVEQAFLRQTGRLVNDEEGCAYVSWPVCFV